MSLLVPSGPLGAPSAQAGSDSVHARREGGDGEFTDALSQVASDRGEGGGQKHGAGKAKEHGAIASQSSQKAMGHGEPIAQDAAEKAATADLLAAISAERMKKTGQRPDKQGQQGKDVPDAVESVASTASGSADATATAGALDALIALGVGVTGAAEQASVVTQAHAEKAAAALAGMRQTGARSAKIEDNSSTLLVPDVAAGPEEEIVPVRVVRQETHFQPVMRDAQRLASGSDALGEATSAPASPAALARSLLNREIAREQTVAASAARALEPGAAVAAPGMISEDPQPGNVGIQIADRIQQALNKPAAAEAVQSSLLPGEPTQRVVYAPAIRSLTLHLTPASLGAVTITLTGSEEAVRIHLEAELADTVGKVEQDRSVLSSRLNGAGYAVTELTISRASSQGADADMRDSGARNGGAQGDASGGSARDGQGHFSGERGGRSPGERQGTDVFNRPLGPKTVASEQVISGISYAGRFRPV